MDRKKINDIAIYIALIILFLAPRIPKINSFVTLDEPAWLSQGANFYYALGQREFDKTVYEYQPAVTTMWVVTFGMLAYFPEYRGFGQGYFDYEKNSLDPFMLEKGYDPLLLLAYSRLIQVFVILVLYLVLYYLLQKFIPKLAAALAVVFVTFDPYYLGLTRMITHEAMVSLFVLVSLMALAVYFLKERRFSFLLISGVAAGFAQLSKSSAIAMLAGVGVLLLAQLLHEKQQGWGKAILNVTKSFALWLIILAITYFVFWPGMWVAPGKMLYEVYGNAFSYAFQGARLKVTEDLDVSQFSLNAAPANIWEIAKILLYRTTPFTWLGVLFGFALPFTRDPNLSRQNKLFFTLLLTNTVAFILLIGLAQGRNSPHYILSSYVSVNLLAVFGWFHALQWLSTRTAIRPMQFQYAGMGLILLLQIWSAVSFFPYYFTYRNPILHAAGWYSQYPQKPYGETLEIAAHYLAGLPDAADTTAFVYYSRGCFSYFYPGESVSFRPYYVDGAHAEDLLRNLQASDYLVVYYANQVQLEKYDTYLGILSAVEPFHVIWMDGYEYVRIYKVDDLTPEIYTALENL
jgi:hypothetical protein